MWQYTDEAVQRQDAQQLMKRISHIGVQPEKGQLALESLVVLHLVDDEELEETVNQSHGPPGNLLTRQECAESRLSESERNQVIER